MGIHSVDKEGKVSGYKKMAVSLERQIEDLIEKNPSLLAKDLIIIGRQIETTEGKIVDLLGIDKEGSVVIIELKKDQAPRKVISQILDYGVWAEGLTYESLNAIAKERHLHNHKTLMEKFQEWTDDIDPEFNQTQKLYVVAEEIDPQTEQLARYLRRKGIELFCIELNFYEKDGHQLVDTREIIGEESIPTSRSRISYSEEDHLHKGSETMKQLYHLLKTEVLKLGNDITINPVKGYIGYIRNRQFFAIKIRSGHLRVTLVTQAGFSDPKELAKIYRKTRKNLRLFMFDDKEQLPYLMQLIKQTYETN